MLPIYWRYALKIYLQVFILSTSTFIGMLVVSRFKEVARFSALSGSWVQTSWFLVYQFPLILPMAIPLSALIASLLFFQKISKSQELTALRASGLSLYAISGPVFIASLFLALGNLWICAEAAPHCRKQSKNLFYQKTSENPLLLMQRQKLIQLQGIYLDLKVQEEGTKAKDLIFVGYHPGNQRLNLLTARQLTLQDEELIGKDTALIAHLPSSSEETFDPLILENQESLSTSAPIVSLALKKQAPRPQAPTMNLKMVQIQTQEPGKPGKVALTELYRRLSLSFAVFSFTLLGGAFGMETGRVSSRKNLLFIFSLAATVLLSYLMGKQLRDSWLWITLAFSGPHLLIWILSGIRLHRLSRGLS